MTTFDWAVIGAATPTSPIAFGGPVTAGDLLVLDWIYDNGGAGLPTDPGPGVWTFEGTSDGYTSNGLTSPALTIYSHICDGSETQLTFTPIAPSGPSYGYSLACYTGPGLAIKITNNSTGENVPLIASAGSCVAADGQQGFDQGNNGDGTQVYENKVTGTGAHSLRIVQLSAATNAYQPAFFPPALPFIAGGVYSVGPPEVVRRKGRNTFYHPLGSDGDEPGYR